MRSIARVVTTAILLLLPHDAADAAAASDRERLAASRATWERARGAAKGDYSYEVQEIFLMSRQTTRIVVKDGKVVERSFEQFVSPPAAPPPGGPAFTATKKWTETGADLGTHGDGAAPARTVDELYDEAAKLVAAWPSPPAAPGPVEPGLAPAPVNEFRERSLGIDDRGFLHHCFERDTRIADDAPLGGVKPFRITIDTDGESGQR